MKKPTVCQNLSRTQMTFAADKTICGNQMETMDEHQTLSVRADELQWGPDSLWGSDEDSQ